MRRVLKDKKRPPRKDATYEARPIANDGEEVDRLVRFLFEQAPRVLKPGGNLCCCCSGGGSSSRKGSPREPTFAWWSIWMDKHLDFKQMIVWDKGPIGLGWHYRRSYEVVLVATKPGKACKWYDNSDEVENIIRPGDYGIRKIIPRADDHPTPKPVELAGHFVRLHTAKGDTVLDPFMGAGWVAEACRIQGRNFIGIEIDPKWHAAAVGRTRPRDLAAAPGVVIRSFGHSKARARGNGHVKAVRSRKPQANELTT